MYRAVDTDLYGDMKTSNLQDTWQIHTIRSFVLHITIPMNNTVLMFFLLFILEDILCTAKKISRRRIHSKETKSQKKLDFALYCGLISPCLNENHRRTTVATKSFLFKINPYFLGTLSLLWHFSQVAIQYSIFFIQGGLENSW